MNIDPTDAIAWLSPGNAGGGMVSGEAHGEAAGYEESLTLDPTDAMVWLSLGAPGGGRVAAEAYSETACYGKSLKVDPTEAMVWLSLRTAGRAWSPARPTVKPYATRRR